MLSEGERLQGWPRREGCIFAGLNNPLLAGNMAAIFGSGIVMILVSHIFPNKKLFDWEDFKTKITTSDDHVRNPHPCIPVTLIA